MIDVYDDHTQWLNDFNESLHLYHNLYGETAMKVGEVYKSSSNSLKAEDLKGKAVKVRISGWDLMEFDGKNGKEKKIVLSFDGKEKTLVCNVTNSRIIATQFGDEIDNWIGKEITLYPTKVDFAGEMVDAIRVKDIIPDADPDDDIPF